jgi:hypothetical protein
MVLFNMTKLVPAKSEKHTGYISLMLNMAEHYNMIEIDACGIWFFKAPMKLMNLRLDSRVYLYTLAGPGNISEIYKVAPSLPVISNQLGTWSFNDSFNLTGKFIWERRKTLTGLILQIATENVSNTFTFTSYLEYHFLN